MKVKTRAGIAAAICVAFLLPALPAQAAYYQLASGNQCTAASFEYSYWQVGSHAGQRSYQIDFGPGSIQDLCGNDNYGGVLQMEYRWWSSSSNAWRNQSWKVIEHNSDNEYITFDGFGDYDVKDVHFRVCNRHDNGTYIGTCGASTGG